MRNSCGASRRRLFDTAELARLWGGCYTARPLHGTVEIQRKSTPRNEKKEVDEHRETLHNLASLLLTNKTIRKRSKAVPNTKLFNNKQSISVGV
jgi:hypothetical protein